MIKHLLPIMLMAAIWPFVGYYESIEDAEVHSNFFIKRKPSLQLKFFNLYANDGDPRPLSKLTPSQRQKVMDYCQYRLGIATQLETAEDLESCQKR
jgi:hypothetical protein